MPLSQLQEDREHTLRVMKMEVEIDHGRIDIEKLRTDISMQFQRLDHDRVVSEKTLRRQTAQIVFAAIGVAVAMFAAGAAWAAIFFSHR